jgi:hypothetical protein
VVRGLGQKLFFEFSKMRVRTRVSICARLALSVFLVVAGATQIVCSAGIWCQALYL